LDNRLVLPVGTVLDAGYRIMRVVGSGGFGITYEAEDINLGTTVALKEYYPFDFGDRDATMSVKPKSERHKQTFDWGRSNFLQEARTLARFEHPSIVRVTRVFEANATAYMVMRFEEGQSFEAWLRDLGRPPAQDEIVSIVVPLLDALETLHAQNFLHRDIAPDNIIVRADGTPVLLDFGSARRAVAEASRALTGVIKAGYSPNEQYTSNSRLQGPWSDLYALGGTLYRAVTGQAPEEATLRVHDDLMPTAARLASGDYTPHFRAASDACLRVRHSERPQSVQQLRAMLLQKSLGKERGLRHAMAPLAFRPPAPRWIAGAAGALALAVIGVGYGGHAYVPSSKAIQNSLAAASRQPPTIAEISSRLNRLTRSAGKPTCRLPSARLPASVHGRRQTRRPWPKQPLPGRRSSSRSQEVGSMGSGRSWASAAHCAEPRPGHTASPSRTTKYWFPVCRRAE
jgi:serine/threonine protein kinase